MRHPAVTIAVATTLLGTASFTNLVAAAEEVVLHKTPQCGCCEAYADYLRANGLAVTVEPTPHLAAMSRAAGIPDDFQGCHLAFIDGYVVSGHVPMETVNRLLDERPDILGVTLPGMPEGSPGMTGTQSEPFIIYAVGGDQPTVYAVDRGSVR